MSKEGTKKDVVVIGGGLAGLATAVYLGRGGRQVTLLERAPRLGGRAATIRERGYFFNLGPHALYRGGAANRVLGELGVRYSGHDPLSRGSFAVDARGLHPLPTSLGTLLGTSLLGWRDKLEGARFLAAVTRVDAQGLDGTSVREWLQRSLRRPATRRWIEAMVRLVSYVHAPSEMSAGCALRQIQMASEGGVAYVDQGWGGLVADLARKARQVGVEIRTEARVVAVERGAAGREGARLLQVVVSGDEPLHAPTVIVAASPEVARRLVGRGSTPPPDLRRYAEESIPVEAACLDLGLTRLPHPERAFALGIDEPLYFSVHSASAQLAPAGKALVHVARYLAPGSSAPGPSRGPGRDVTRRQLETFLDRVQPGWKDCVEESRFLPRMTVCHRLPRAEQRGLEGRPGVRVTGWEGLFLAGDWVGTTGHLADASLGSARSVAEEVLGGTSIPRRRCAGSART